MDISVTYGTFDSVKTVTIVIEKSVAVVPLVVARLSTAEVSCGSAKKTYSLSCVCGGLGF